MIPLDLKDALGALHDSVDLINTLWNLFAIVTLGVVTFAYGKDGLRDSPNGRHAVALAFAIFALANAFVLYEAQSTYQAIVEVLQDPTRPVAGALSAGQVNFAPVLHRLRAVPPLLVAAFQLMLSYVAFRTIWAPRAMLSGKSAS